MNIKQAMQTAARNLLVNRGRFAQALLGMVAGVAGLVMVLMLGAGVLSFNELFFDCFAPGLFRADVGQSAAYDKTVGIAEMERLAKDNPEVIKAVSPLVGSYSFELTLRHEDNKFNDAVMYGVGENYLAMYNNLYVQEGRFLQTMDIAREQKVCVIGHDIASALFPGGALGETLKIYGENLQVVGVLSNEPNVNYQLFIPYTSAYKIFGEKIETYNDYSFYEDKYFVLANGAENIREARLLLEDMLRAKTGGETGSVWEFGTRWTLSTVGAGNVGEIVKGGIYAYIWFGVLAAGFVLLISCVGIMNMMLAVVKERTKEIGVRRAFGATDIDIKRQFTLEAVAISLIGGALGVALGLAAVWIMAAAGAVIPIYGGYQVRLEDMNWLSLCLSILAAFAACSGVGLISATYPAQQAAKMEIVAAINAD